MAKHGGYIAIGWKETKMRGRNGFDFKTKPGKSGRGGGYSFVHNKKKIREILDNNLIIKGQTINDNNIVWQGLIDAVKDIEFKAALKAATIVQGEVMMYADQQYKTLFENDRKGVLTGNTKMSIMSAVYLKTVKVIKGLQSVEGKRATRRKLSADKSYKHLVTDRYKHEDGTKSEYIRVKNFNTGKWVKYPVDKITAVTSGGLSRSESYQYLVNHTLGKDVGTKKMVSGFVFVTGDPSEPRYVEGLDVFFNTVVNYAYNLYRKTFSDALKSEIRAYRASNGKR